MRRRCTFFFLLMIVACVVLPRIGFGQALPTATGPGSSLRVGGGLANYYGSYGRTSLGGGQV
ncbi:MAG: hypothetical protein NVSMB3_04730 [Acidobacteriaceae bacterium]